MVLRYMNCLLYSLIYNNISIERRKEGVHLSNRSLFKELSSIYQDDEDAKLMESISGIRDTGRLIDILNDFCIRYLDQRIYSCHFSHLSVGASFGLLLENGLDVLLKMSKVRQNGLLDAGFLLSSLTAASHVQDILHNMTFPCPAILCHPLAYHDVIITVYAYADIGKQEDAHDSSIRRTSAESLAELIKLASPYKALHGFSVVDNDIGESLYPVPHNALFDFAIGADEAGWIDEIAIRSKQRIKRIEKNMVIGHCDWSMKNMRFADENLVMVYDWDSLILADEFDLLGNAARAFTTTWDIPVKITPSQEEAYAFVQEYEIRRKKRFTKNEWVKISAYATYHMLDFGEGFYTTSNREQAERWSERVAERRNMNAQIISEYEYEFDFDAAVKDITVISFSKPDESWLDFVCQNRSGKVPSMPYDIAIGPVANDQVYTVVTLFEQGLLQREAAITELKVRKLYNQTLFHTEKSLQYCHYIRSFQVGGASSG